MHCCILISKERSTTCLHVVLQRVMNARQFGLKLIANVTYGYTSAGFSGRMPMAEIADSIVQVSSPTTKTVSDYHKCCTGHEHLTP